MASRHGPSPDTWSAGDRATGSSSGGPLIGAQQLAPLVSITRTEDDFSIVCPDGGFGITSNARRDGSASKVTGPLNLAAVDILAALVDPIRDQGISVFALSTYDTDYLPLPELQRDDADHPRAISISRTKLCLVGIPVAG